MDKLVEAICVIRLFLYQFVCVFFILFVRGFSHVRLDQSKQKI